MVEGEKDCDALHGIGVVATCNAGGAGKWTAEHAAFLGGRRVIMVPDNDEAGATTPSKSPGRFTASPNRCESPKTERHEGGASRIIPLFAELRSALLEAFDEAEEGADYIITRYRDSNTNLRTQFHKIIRPAGYEPWPKLFENLRRTRETELAESFPMHVVCKWIGNSELVAAKHYLQLTDEHFIRATSEKAAHKRHDGAENDPNKNRPSWRMTR